MKIGYARISTPEQNINSQIDALKNAGCEKIYQDVLSGSKTQRPGLAEALEYAREGDTVMVWRLDRLGRSVQELIKMVKKLEERKIAFTSLQETIDTATSGGKLIFHMFSALAEFERDVVRERTHAGLASARARGRMGGRPQKLDDVKIHMLCELYDLKKNKIGEICDLMGITKRTLYKYVNKRKMTASPIEEKQVILNALY